jgi:hypothetical protein
MSSGFSAIGQVPIVTGRIAYDRYLPHISTSRELGSYNVRDDQGDSVHVNNELEEIRGDITAIISRLDRLIAAGKRPELKTADDG